MQRFLAITGGHCDDNALNHSFRSKADGVANGPWAVRQMVRKNIKLSPIQAIQAATINSANLLNWQNDVGSMAKGKYADMVAVDNNPLEDISVLESVKFVMEGGWGGLQALNIK